MLSCFCSQGLWCLPHCMLGYTHTPLDTPPRRTILDTTPGHTSPLDTPPADLPPDTPRTSNPSHRDTTGYGQQAGGMHPTGMHTCISLISGCIDMSLITLESSEPPTLFVAEKKPVLHSPKQHWIINGS